MRHRGGQRALAARLLLLHYLGLRAGSAQECSVHNCLPADNTQWPPVCYQQIAGLLGKPPAESFGSCPKEFPRCDYCPGDPPCESHCSTNSLAIQPLGSACVYDEQCQGPFARCLQRVCRNFLYTHQVCSAGDPNDVCGFGLRSCFRGRCQGLRQGDSCSWRPEGKDIDCNPGWYCYLGVCTPQLPGGHTCTGQHAHECVRGYRCNLALPAPQCGREYTLDVGALSSEPALCKSNHVNPNGEVCAQVPEILYRLGRPLVSGIDCQQSSDCNRADSSLGQCLCKRWWDGGGSGKYCELVVQNTGRPSFKLFWQSSVAMCHQDWTPERCAAEIGMEDLLRDIKAELEARLSDPTEVPSCAAQLLADRMVTKGAGGRGRLAWVAAAGALAAALLPDADAVA